MLELVKAGWILIGSQCLYCLSAGKHHSESGIVHLYCYSCSVNSLRFLGVNGP